MTPWRMRALICAGLVSLGAGLLLVGSSLRATSARLVRANAPVSREAGDARAIDANNSPTLVRSPVDPAHVAVVNRVDTPRFSCALHVSVDDGDHWREVAIPFPGGEELPPRCFAPDAAFGPDGTLYVSFVTLQGLGNVPNAAWVAASPAGGSALSSPRRVVGPHPFQVRLAADPDRAGRLYLTWLQASEVATLAFPTPGNPIVLARSDDGGTTWSSPVRVSPPERGRVVAPTVATTGARVDVAYLDVGGDVLDYHGAHDGRGGPPYDGPWSLVLARSEDGGRTWAESVVDAGLVPTERFVVFFPPSPSLAVDGSGDRVYVGYTDGRWGDADVAVWASSDGGASFGRPRRVNDTPPADDTGQYRPELAVAPDGRLDVVYYDRRSDSHDVQTEVSLQSSADHGDTFTPRLRLSDRTFDSGIGFGSERALPDLGSRLGLVSNDDRALAVWSDTRAGTRASGKQDLATAVLAFSTGPTDLGSLLRWAGWGLAGAGAVLALLWLARFPLRLPRAEDGAPDHGEDAAFDVPVRAGWDQSST